MTRHQHIRKLGYDFLVVIDLTFMLKLNKRAIYSFSVEK